MIRLKDLILESKASEEAKRRGLVHKGGGNYAQSKGDPTVARSEGDKLVAVKGAKEPKKKTSKRNDRSAKMQQSMSELAHSVKPSIWSGKHRSIQPKDPRGRKKAALNVLENQINPDEKVIYLHPYHKKSAKELNDDPNSVYSVVDEYDVKEAVDGGFIKADSIEEKMVDRYVEIRGNNKELEEQGEYAEEATPEWAEMQHKRWASRSRFGYEDIEDLRAVVEDLVTWTNSGNWKTGDADVRRWRNNRINHLSWNDGKPTTLSNEIKVIERGMTIPPEDIEEFLKSFEVGKEVGLPPSGWSTRSNLAREFGAGSSITEGINIQLRLNKPKNGLHLNGLKGALKQHIEYHVDKIVQQITDGIENGEFGETEYQDFYDIVARYRDSDLYDSYEGIGYAFDDYLGDITNFVENERQLKHDDRFDDREEKWDRVEFELGQLKEISDGYSSWSPYDDECEVVRPGWASNKVKSIKKYISYTGGWSYDSISPPEVTYVIEMEEGKVIKDPQLFVEFRRKKPRKIVPTSTTKKYVNAPVVPFRKVKSKKKKLR